MSAKIRIAVIGDVHLAFDERDVEALDGAGYDLVAFVGDLAGYRLDGTTVARCIARLKTPALVIPGNHDAASLAHLGAETFERPRLAWLLGRGQERRCRKLREAIAPVPLAGYSRHPVKSGELELGLVAGRPHSQGGSFFAFARHLYADHGVKSFEGSAKLLSELVEQSPEERLVFLAHNGPTGLGSRRHDIWGCDFRREEGDWGDRDLEAAIAHARGLGKRVLAVIAGHMHHRIKGGGERRWQLEREGTLYVNAARVPRIERRGTSELRYHVRVETDGERASAELVSEPA